MPEGRMNGQEERRNFYRMFDHHREADGHAMSMLVIFAVLRLICPVGP